MKKISKNILAILLTASMICGLLTPASAWLIPFSRLRSPDGTYWFDMTQLYSGMWIGVSTTNVETIVWTEDGVVWYTEDGLSYYLGLTQAPAEGWTSRALTYDDRSPDSGKMWLMYTDTGSWYNWDAYWYDTSAPEYLYTDANSYVLRTEPFTGYLSQIGVWEFDDGSSQNGETIFTFSARSFPGTGVALSADGGLTWKSELTADELNQAVYGYSDPYACRLAPVVSFDPESRRMTRGDWSRYPVATFTDDTYYPGQGYYGRYQIYLRSFRDCTIMLHMNYNAPNYVFCMLDLMHLSNMNGSNLTVTYPSGYSLPATQYCILNQSNQSYCPIRSYGVGMAVTDENGNFIIDPPEVYDYPGMLGNVVTSVQDVDISIRMQAYETVTLPIWIWAEGQSPNAVGNICSNDAHFALSIARIPDANEQSLYPLYYREDPNTDTVTITDFDVDYFSLFTNGTAGDPYGTGCYFDPATGTLTLPSTVNGKTVTAIGNYALSCITDRTMFDAGASVYNAQQIVPPRQIILPNTVEQIGAGAFGNLLERVHVPYNAAIEPDTFLECRSDLTICCDMLNSLAQQTLATYYPNNTYSFVQCTEHGTSVHTHAFTQQGDTVPPGYLNGGYTEYFCACGESEQRDQTACLPLPEVSAPSGQSYPGETLKTTVTVENIAGLANLHLDVSYNTQALRLVSAACPALAPDGSDGTMTWYASSVGFPSTATVTLTFEVLSDAPSGEQEIAVTASGTSVYPVDEGGTVTSDAGVGLALVQDTPLLSLYAPTVPVYTGDTVQVQAVLVENPGLTGMSLLLGYDPDVLELTGVTKSGMLEVGNVTFSGTLSAVPFTVLWEDSLAAAAHTDAGTILTFTFRVKDGATAGTTTVSMTYDADGTYDFNMNNVPLRINNTALTVVRHTPGDSDGDGVIDLKDVTSIVRYLAGGWDDPAPDMRNADVNGDGKVNLKDVTTLRRYMAGWPVTLV